MPVGQDDLARHALGVWEAADPVEVVPGDARRSRQRQPGGRSADDVTGFCSGHGRDDAGGGPLGLVELDEVPGRCFHRLQDRRVHDAVAESRQVTRCVDDARRRPGLLVWHWESSGRARVPE